MKTLVLGIVSFFILFGCDGGEGEKIKMTKKYESMTTRCVGRNFISIPGDFRQSPVTTGIFRATGSEMQHATVDVIVRAGKFNREQFALEVQKRRVDMLRGGDELVNVVRLEKEFDDGSILLRLQQIKDAYVSEINFLRGENMVTARLESFHDKYLEVEESLIKFAAKVKVITQNEHGAGFCLGAVEVTGDFDAEVGSFWFVDGRGSDFEVDINTYVTDDKTSLLERIKGPSSLLAAFDVNHKVLRARERVVAGMRAQEWLGWAKLSDEPDAKTLKFALETMRPKPSRAQPSISITFNTAKALDDGTPTKTLISDDEALQLWDVVIESIRSRGT